MSVLDRAVESAGRWTAARSTRRSFLGRMGKVAVMVASGPVVATLLAEDAEARVCGQSGVSPKCATFDCDATWGWCWYANGCCAGGLLKKICDCCSFNYPNVHGYCPTGYNVKCIVESCGTDPRLQTVALNRVLTDDLATVAATARATRFPAGSPIAVLGDAVDPLAAAVAAPVAAVLGGPLLRVARSAATSSTLDALAGLGATRVVIAGGALPPALDDSLRNAGYAVERVGASPDIGPFSSQVGTFIREVNGVAGTVCIVPSGTSLAAAPIAAAYAGALGYPLLVGVEQAQAAQVPTLMVGPEAAARVGDVPGSSATAGTSISAIAAELANKSLAAGTVAVDTVVLVPRTSPAINAVTDFGAPIAVHEPGSLTGARDWLYARQATYGRAARAYMVGSNGRLGDPGVLELQSILNGFETRLLIGVAGQGLPVIPQPLDERCIGCARVGAMKRSAKAPPAYWGQRAVDASEGG